MKDKQEMLSDFLELQIEFEEYKTKYAFEKAFLNSAFYYVGFEDRITPWNYLEALGMIDKHHTEVDTLVGSMGYVQAACTNKIEREVSKVKDIKFKEELTKKYTDLYNEVSKYFKESKKFTDEATEVLRLLKKKGEEYESKK